MKRLLTAVAIGLAACSPSTPLSSDIALSEFDLQMQESLNSGTTTLSIQNDGEFGHTVVVADESGRVIAATGLIGGGEASELTVDLAPGRYEFTCRIVFQGEDGSLSDHYEQGMHSTVTVGS